MNLVALCKTFRGDEWLLPMTLAIYPYISKIVFVNSEISWSGRHGNHCKKVINEMKETIDPDDKIISLDFDTINQFEQDWHGYKWIEENLNADYVMLVDTDEIWDDHDLKVAKNHIEMHPEFDTYKTNIYTYIKSPLYRVDPIEPLQPVSFIRMGLEDLGGHARCCDPKFKARLVLDEGDSNSKIFYHHYVYVRNEFNTVLEKIITSHVSEHRYYYPMDVWIPEVWNKLPNLEGIWKTGFHPAEKFRRNWKGVKEISPDVMPRILRVENFPILKQFGVVN
jgi:hypothetical protein